MSIFGLLIVPLPYTLKRKLFTFVSENPLIAKLQYGMKVALHVYPSLLQHAHMTIDYVHLHIDPLHRQCEPCLQRSSRIGQNQEQPKVRLSHVSKPLLPLTSNQLRHARRFRPHGSASPQVLLSAQHVPLRLHALPLPYPQPHLRVDPRHTPSRRESQALRR